MVKPRETFNKIMIMGFVDIGKKLTTLVQMGEVGSNTPPKNYKEALDQYKNTAAKYIQELNSVIELENEKTQVEWIVNDRQVDAKKLKTGLLRGSKMLRACCETASSGSRTPRRLLRRWNREMGQDGVRTLTPLTGVYSKDAIMIELKAASTIVKQCGEALGAILKETLV